MTQTDVEPRVEQPERLIAAYHRRYRDAGRWKTVVWVGSFCLFVAAVSMSIFTDGKAALGLVGAAYVLCSRVMLRPELTRAHRDGVTLQEQYDVVMFALPWNEGLVGRQLQQADVEDLFRRYKGDRHLLQNWYVEGHDAPPTVEVLLRQWENATWGRRDHNAFAKLAAYATVLSVIVTGVVGVLNDMALGTYVSVLAAPSLPWLLDLAELSSGHRQAAIDRADVESQVQRAWDSAIARRQPAVPVANLRLIQDRLYRTRLAYGRVPTWFYKLREGRNHRALTAATEHLLAEQGWYTPR